MKVKLIIIISIFFLMVVNAGFSQNFFKNPESVVFDKSGDRYLVSNKGNGNIISVQKDGKQSVFNSDQSSIRGLTIVDNVLYAACNMGVAGFNLKTGKRLFVIDIKEKKFLNDITSDAEGNLYVSDTGGNRIYKIDPEKRNYKMFTENIKGPNGLLFDEDKNRLLACLWGANGSIMSIDMNTGKASLILKTKFSGLDGLAKDRRGRIYLSSWGSGTVYRFSSNFKIPPEKISKGHNGPADIFFNKDENVLAVPNFKANMVDFIKVKE